MVAWATRPESAPAFVIHVAAPASSPLLAPAPSAPAVDTDAPGPCVPLRIEALDLEICGPPGTRVLSSTEPVTDAATRDPCPGVTLWAPMWSEASSRTRVGTLEVVCLHHGRPACIAMCESLRPVPNSTATEPFPIGPPIIVMSRSGGDIPNYSDSVMIWADGSLLFAGLGCSKLRGHRARVNASHGGAVLAWLEGTGYFAAVPRAGQDGRGRGESSLCVTAGGRSYTTTRREVPRIDVASAARRLVDAMVGANPC